MPFEIHNPQGIAINLLELDKEACEFWNYEPLPLDRSYAHPNIEKTYTNSWFVTIGWAIHHPETYTEGWNNVKCTLWTIQARGMYDEIFNGELIMDKIIATREYLKPYFDLINHWESKGYIPVNVKD